MKFSFGAAWKKLYFRIPVYIVITVLLFFTTGVLAMDSLLFPAAGEVRSPKYGNISLRSGEAVLDAYFYAGNPDKPVILYSHGNGETLRYVIPQLQDFIRQGYSVMAYDYAGYGASSGSPSEKQAYLDVEAAYKYLIAEKNTAPENIVIMGFSLGSGPSCYIAGKYPVKALVIVSGFASAAQVLLPFSVPFDQFPNAKRLKRCAVPLLLIHGKNDKVIPVRNGKKNFDSSGAVLKKIYLVDDAGHNDIFYRTPGFFDKLEKFLTQIKPQ